MASRHIVEAAIVAVTVIERDPAGEMRHRFRACPIGIVLVPGNYPSMMRRLAKKLIVPKTYRPTQQLRSRHQECRTPKHIVESRCCPPGSQCVKQNRVRIL